MVNKNQNYARCLGYKVTWDIGEDGIPEPILNKLPRGRGYI